MIRTEESKRLWKQAQATKDFDTMDKIESEWENMAEEAATYWDNRPDGDSIDDMDYNEFAAQCDDSEWTDDDETGLEEHEENKRRRLAETNEY